jgi:hypothetical protein
MSVPVTGLRVDYGCAAFFVKLPDFNAQKLGNRYHDEIVISGNEILNRARLTGFLALIE